MTSRAQQLIELKYVFIFGVFYSIVLPLLKVTILTEWCRMFAPQGHLSEGYFWWGCAIVIFIQVASGIDIVISLNLQCIPHSAIWDITIQATSKCFDLYQLQVASARSSWSAMLPFCCCRNRLSGVSKCPGESVWVFLLSSD